jgi:hypothetical protein
MDYLERSLQTNVVIQKDSSASWMKILEPSKVVNLAVNDYPLKMDELKGLATRLKR